VFVVDDHEIMRRGLVASSTTSRTCASVGQAGTVGEASPVPERLPDVAVRTSASRRRRPAALRDLQLRCPEVRCLMLIPCVDEDTAYAAYAAGACGVCPSTFPERADQRDRIVARAAGYRSRATARPTADPDPRERGVLRLIGEGLTNRQIAERLNLAEKTVKNYVSSVLGKLGSRRRTQAAVMAHEQRHRL